MTLEQMRARGKASALLREAEGLRLIPYRDEAGHLTVGIGHRTESTKPISIKEAYEFFHADIAVVEKVLTPFVLNVNQRAALTSFVFNVGVSAFEKSTLAAKLRAGDYVGASAELLRWNKITVDGVKRESKGLTIRREAERALFDCERDL